jgi:hypothetical protein
MVVVELLEALGVSHAILLVVSAALALMHGREAMQMLAAAGLYARIGGLFAFLFVVVMSGIVPGIHVEVDIGALANVIGDLWSLLPVEKFLP